MIDMPEAKAAAVQALTNAADKRPSDKRLSATTIRTVVDIAWRYQFEPTDRAAARRELKEALSPEYLRARKGTS